MQMSINIHSPVAVYTQIENQIQFAIARGELKPGDTLLPTKKLAKELEVNWNTVTKAYRTLELLGLIYTRRGEGCFIEKGAAEKARSHCFPNIVKSLHEVTQEAKATGMSKKDLQEIISATLKADSVPYGDVPKSVMGLVKRK